MLLCVLSIAFFTYGSRTVGFDGWSVLVLVGVVRCVMVDKVGVLFYYSLIWMDEYYEGVVLRDVACVVVMRRYVYVD